MSGRRSHRLTDDDIEGAMDFASRKMGFASGFRKQQTDALRSFLLGHDLFVTLPTGYGKSVVFQAAPLCVDFLRCSHSHSTVDPDSVKAVALVVMPLKSLIADQIQKAGKFGLLAGDLSGGLTDDIREGLAAGRFSLVFASPENLLEDGQEIFQLLKDCICGFFIDESHCVSKWGTAAGDTKAFRSAYGKLGELRSKLKSSVPVVGLTATATRDVRAVIIDSLGLKNYVWIKESPDKKNIKHVVINASTRDFDSMFKWITDDIISHGVHCPRIIIYCQSRKTCSELYAAFLVFLPESHHKYINMYHTNTENNVQHDIVTSMGRADGEVRLLIATIAYGMGVDSADVHTVILCGHPNDLDDYVQLSGRVGRDGKPSVAITVCYPGDSTGRVTSASMKKFLGGSTCRRSVIKGAFGDGDQDTATSDHTCCDVCAERHEHECRETDMMASEEKMRKAVEKMTSEEYPLNIPTEHQIDHLERELEEYRQGLLLDETEHIYCGSDILSGLPFAVIAKIMKEVNVQMPFQSFRRRYGFPNNKMALDVWDIVCTCLGRDPTFGEGDNAYEDETDVEVSEPSDDEYQRPAILSDSDSD